MAASVPSFVDTFLVETAQECRARGWQVDLAVNTAIEPLLARDVFDRVWHCSWQRGFERPVSTLASTVQLRRIMQTGAYTVVQAHTPSASMAARLAVPTLRRRPKLVCTAHGFVFGPGLSSWEHRAAMAVERALLSGPDVLILLNREDYDWAKRRRKGPTLLSRGIGVRDAFLDASIGDKAMARSVIGLGQDDFVVVTIGELRPRKRPHLAIASVASLEGLPRHLILVGKGPLREELGTQSDAAMAQDPSLKVTFTEFLPDVRGPLVAADVLLHTSEREGLPTALLEAMAMRRPVVAVDIRGVHELIEGGGGIATGPTVVEVTQALRRFWDDPDLAEQVAVLGRTTAEKYRRSALARETCDLYAALA